MAKIKCTNCGCTELKEVFIYDIVSASECSSPRDPVNNYACMKCGHVETYLCELDPVAREKREAAEKGRERVLSETLKQAEDCIAEFKKLSEIILDENSTQRQAREARVELNKVQDRFKREYYKIRETDSKTASKLHREMEEARNNYVGNQQRDRNRYN